MVHLPLPIIITEALLHAGLYGEINHFWDVEHFCFIASKKVRRQMSDQIIIDAVSHDIFIIVLTRVVLCKMTNKAETILMGVQAHDNMDMIKTKKIRTI